MSARSLPPLADRASAVTSGCTHVRAPSSVRAMLGTLCVALVPCLVAGMLNTGDQANAALARLGAEAPRGWRVACLEAAGISLEPGLVFGALAHGALYLLPALGVAWLVGAGWERLFAGARRREREPGLLTTALLFVLLLPPGAPLWHVAVGMSLATVLAKELFGGTGMGFVSPAALGVALLALAWPAGTQDPALWTGLKGYTGSGVFDRVAAGGVDALARDGPTLREAFLGRAQGAMGATSPLACLLGAAFLLVRGAASWRATVGVVVGAAAAVVLVGPLGLSSSPVAALGLGWHLVLGSLAFAAVFLVNDPGTAALTRPGRWAAGILVGFLVVLIRVANPLHPDGVVFAVLFANVAAPLADAAAVGLNVRRRRRRHA